MVIKKYYLIQGVFYSSIGGHDTHIDIADVSYERESLLEKVKETLDDENIETINGYVREEYEFVESEDTWEISYKVDGATVSDVLILRIIEREE